jgi:hypothetical protein
MSQDCQWPIGRKFRFERSCQNLLRIFHPEKRTLTLFEVTSFIPGHGCPAVGGLVPARLKGFGGERADELCLR